MVNKILEVFVAILKEEKYCEKNVDHDVFIGIVVGKIFKMIGKEPKSIKMSG